MCRGHLRDQSRTSSRLSTGRAHTLSVIAPTKRVSLTTLKLWITLVDNPREAGEASFVVFSVIRATETTNT